MTIAGINLLLAVPWILIKDLAAILGNKHEVFNSYPKLPGQVDSRFHRKNHPHLKRDIRSKAYIRRFMTFEADPVTKAVGKVLAIPALGNNIPCRFIDLRKHYPRFYYGTAVSLACFTRS